MILFIFEGDEREPRLYRTLERLYFPKENDNIICSFGNNIYNLYNELLEYGGDGDIVSVMRERLADKGDSTLDGIRSSDISEIFLFFDYDFQNSQLSLEEINQRVEEMLTLFADETDNGKLYINYPMIESIRYTKELPDAAYVNYVVCRKDCRNFKQLACDFSDYDSLDYILFKDGEIPTKEKYIKVKDNWQYLKQMNVCKANLLITGQNMMPTEKDIINQQAIFNNQRLKYVDSEKSVAILNSFPIFIYEYMK
ncbi:MAG: hypothetical protein K2G91_03850 [Prevotella sp.]|nr:hypothetical protein [Prevotella sp.]